MHSSAIQHSAASSRSASQPRSRTLAALLTTLWLVWLPDSAALAQLEGSREWTDSTGRFKIVGEFVEIQDGVVFIRNPEGKTVKIPLNRLSKPDQQLLEDSENPFEAVDSPSPSGGQRARAGMSPAAESARSNAGTASSGGASSGAASSGGVDWSAPTNVNWDSVDKIDSLAGIEWNVPLPDSGGIGFEPKRVALPKKSHFFENMHPAVINPLCKRAATGYTVSFSVPKPLTRICLLDLVEGKSVNSDQVEAAMRPLALLNNGTAVLMVGTSDDRGGFEKPDAVQVWRLSGKKIDRTASWVPYLDDKEERGKRSNAKVVLAEPLSDGTVLTLSDAGHLVRWQLAARKPVWHMQLGKNFAIDLSADRKLLAVLDDKVLMLIDPEAGKIAGSLALDGSVHVAWPKLAFSPSGQQLLLTTAGSMRLLDLKDGTWVEEYSSPNGMVATRGLSFPHEEYVLLDNQTLLHLPSKIQVCSYSDASTIVSIGGTAFIGLHSDAGGLLAPGKFPHPAAEKALAKAQKDPTTFPVHPGVAVAIDASGAGQHQAEVRKGLEQAAVASGYVVQANAPVQIVAKITGPTQEAVSYIAAGSYVVNQYVSSVAIVWNGRELWSNSGTNVPGMLMTERGETIQQALQRYGEKPNLNLFSNVRFPKFLQKPPADPNSKGPVSTALMTSKFTLQGLIDSP
jgi:hypothetical protein